MTKCTSQINNLVCQLTKYSLEPGCPHRVPALAFTSYVTFRIALSFFIKMQIIREPFKYVAGKIN